MPEPSDDLSRRLGEFQDPYVDPATGVLRNKVGARTQAELDEIEDAMVEARVIQLKDNPIKPTFDEKHLTAIHRHLFQDVYDWAGERRTVNISKPGDSASFFPCQIFDRGAAATFDQIRGRRFRTDMPRAEFVHRLTETYDELNHLHLFREGNGRTQRIFMTQLAQSAGYQVDWSRTTSKRNDQVSRAAGHDNVEPMWEMLNEIVSRPQPATNTEKLGTGATDYLARNVAGPRRTARKGYDDGLGR